MKCLNEKNPAMNTTTALRNASLIKTLRQRMPAPISLCKKALAESNNDVDLAFKWLQNDLGRVAQKLQNRQATDGLLALKLSNTGACIVELNSESDFVAKSDLFVELAQNVANAAALYNPGFLKTSEVKPEDLYDSRAFRDAEIETQIVKAMGTIGEKISLRRSILYPINLRSILGLHSHSAHALPTGVGKIGTIVRLAAKEELVTKVNEKSVNFANKIAQHISGFSPQTISGGEEALLAQQFLFGGGTVKDVLDKEGMEVIEFTRWELGEGLEKKEESFAEEVAKQMSA